MPCSLGEVGGVGRVAPQKLTSTAAPVGPSLLYNEADGGGGRIAKSCSPLLEA